MPAPARTTEAPLRRRSGLVSRRQPSSYNRAMTDTRPIGVFDSGVGGLTVLHECLVTMPNEDFVYLGDHARLPYGLRSLEEIRRFAPEIRSYLSRPDLKLILVASTAPTSTALQPLTAEPPY